VEEANDIFSLVFQTRRGGGRRVSRPRDQEGKGGAAAQTVKPENQRVKIRAKKKIKNNHRRINQKNESDD
jgi:hypothetical protein